MNDLEINIALSKAMGWILIEKKPFSAWRDNNECAVFGGSLWCSQAEYISLKFDYCDPVIFVAICKHWKLGVNHHSRWVYGDGVYNKQASKSDLIEKSAALCVIDLVKRGIK